MHLDPRTHLCALYPYLYFTFLDNNLDSTLEMSNAGLVLLSGLFTLDYTFKCVKLRLPLKDISENLNLIILVTVDPREMLLSSKVPDLY